MERLLLLLSFLLLSAAISQASEHPAYSYWKTTLPKSPMPSAISSLLEPGAAIGQKSSWRVDAAMKKKFLEPQGYLGATMYFLEKDIYSGSKMTLDFRRPMPSTAFLPRRVADSIPFSSKTLPEVLAKFSITPNSDEANVMKRTLKWCEPTASQGEAKLCATSVESMIDFSISSLGTRDVQAVSAEVKKAESSVTVQEYSIAPSGIKRLPGSKSVACHADPYPYAVFYCHAVGKTKAYKVTLIGKDGTTVEAVAVCHTGSVTLSSHYNPFKELHINPGKTFCHFLPQGHIIWTPRA